LGCFVSRAVDRGEMVATVGSGATMVTRVVIGRVAGDFAMNVSSVCGGWQREEEDEVWGRCDVF